MDDLTSAAGRIGLVGSPAEPVKDLRERTGASVMDCKAALHAVRGDRQGAVEYLRKKELSDAANADLNGASGDRATA